MKTTILISTASLVFTVVSAFGQERAATPANHSKAESDYRQRAGTYEQKQAEEEQIASRWQKQYANWTKSPNPYRSAKNLAAYYGQLANDASVHAAKQDKLSGN